MKKTTRDRILKLLQEEKKSLESKTYVNDIDVDGDEIDEIQGSLIVLVTNQLSTRDQYKLKQIEIALKKIDDNLFGLCEECGDSIHEKRLEANPYFSLCIGCAEQREFEDKQRKRS